MLEQCLNEEEKRGSRTWGLNNGHEVNKEFISHKGQKVSSNVYRCLYVNRCPGESVHIHFCASIFPVNSEAWSLHKSVDGVENVEGFRGENKV